MRLLILPLACLLSYSPAKRPVIKLNGYFACMQSELVPGKTIFSCYALVQRSCQNGTVILAYEKRSSAAKQAPRYQITDTVQVKLSTAHNYLAIATCANAAGKSMQYFVLCKQDALGEKYLRNTLRVWGVNAQGKLVAVPTSTVKCLNDDFGA